MTDAPIICPDCDEALAFTFRDASGLGAQKQGDGYNTTPDTSHYVCFACAAAWKQRLDGPLTPDVVGDLAFFTCRDVECGGRLAVTQESIDPAGMELTCPRGHRHAVRADVANEGLWVERKNV